MVPSTRCYNLIAQFEALRLVAYKPTPYDVWTIGYGHTAGVKQGDVCTPAQAYSWLQLDTATAAHTVNTTVAAPLTQSQFDALVSLVFNIGSENFRVSTILRLLNAKSYALAAMQFPRWNKQKGVVLAGLTKRREAERQLFLSTH